MAREKGPETISVQVRLTRAAYEILQEEWVKCDQYPHFSQHLRMVLDKHAKNWRRRHKCSG